MAGAPQPGDGAQRIGVKVGGSEAAVRGFDRRQAPFPVIDSEDREDVAVLATAGDDRAERSQEGEARHAQLVGPQRPDAGLVDEGLADVEANPSAVRVHASMLDGRAPGRMRFQPGAARLRRARSSCYGISFTRSVPGGETGLNSVR